MTLKARFDALRKALDERVLGNTTLVTTSPEYQLRVKSLLAEFTQFWRDFLISGAYSANDDLDDLGTDVILMLVTPFVMGDLQQREHTAADNRNVVVAKSLTYYDHFLKMCVDLELLTERDVEVGITYNSANRTQRIERSRRQAELQRKMSGLETKLSFIERRNRRIHAIDRSGGAHVDSSDDEGDDDDATELVNLRRARMEQLMAEKEGRSGESSSVTAAKTLRRRDDLDEGEAAAGKDGVDDSEEEATQREFAVAQLEWTMLEIFGQYQLSSRELEMIGAIPQDARERIVAEYQRGIQEYRDGANAKGKNTYTILPGGMGILPGFIGGAAHLNTKHDLKERVRAEMFTERNQPTQSLEEFAQGEMAFVQQQMEAQAAGQQAQVEEDARIGEDGVEERERLKQADWDDWRDANPPIGITTKGNYS